MYLDGCQWIINAQMFIKCNFIYVDNFPPKTSSVCMCELRGCVRSCALSFHSHTLVFAPSALFIIFIILICLSTFTAFRYSINNNSVNLFFPPQQLSRCVHFSCATKSVCFAAVVVAAVAAAAAATMMVYVWPINNTRINIEWRLKLDWTQCRVASEKEHKHTNTHTPRKRVFTHKQKQWQ